jgi:ribonucleoside-diphosphate reductase alpha chain
MKMNKEALGLVAFASQYSHETQKGRETPFEAMVRVRDMHLSFFDEKIHPYIHEAFEQVFEGRVYPSQRSTQFGGNAILKKHWRIYNCTASYCDRPRFFAEYFWLLLCGCGCGVSVQSHHVNKLPPLISAHEMKKRTPRVIKIEDSIEGWAEAVHELILSYMPLFTTDEVNELSFDFSEIRPAGAPISSGGFAPSSAPLEKALYEIQSILRLAILRDQTQLTPLNCFDICASISEAVLSGGVRRSASIMLFDFNDEEMKRAKTGDWYKNYLNRRTANISAVMLGEPNQEQIDEMMSWAKEWGEPAQYWIDSKEICTNPCAEIGLYPQLPFDGIDGGALDYVLPHQMEEPYSLSGWQSCNLTEVNLAKCESNSDFFKAVRSASILGTLQSMYTEEGYLLSASRFIIERERLLGVSLTGIYTNPKIGLDPMVLEQGVRIVRHTNLDLAKALKIDPASRLTCIKPSGNTSTVAGCSAGAHPWHAKRYLRRIRLNLLNPVYKYMKEKLPEACKEISEDTGVITFAVEAPHGSIIRDDLTALEHLEAIAILQKHWVANGSNDAYNKTPAVSHSVSCTVTVKEKEWDEISKWIYNHMNNNQGAERVKGISFLSYFGDHEYKDAPYQTAESGEALDLWRKIAELEIDEKELFEVMGHSPDLAQDPACSGGSCLLN